MATVLFSTAEGARISRECFSLAVQQKEKPSHVSGGGGGERETVYFICCLKDM